MKLSTHNQIRGTVVSIEKGAMDGVVEIEVAPGTIIASSITNASVGELRLEEGIETYAVIKALNVIIGVED